LGVNKPQFNSSEELKMYVAQTYLGFVAKKARVYVYFLSESYMSNRQKDLHEVFLRRTKELGLKTGEDIAVVLPVAGREMDVLGDLRDEAGSPIQKFYQQHIAGNTPGLLLTRAPIDTCRGIKSAIFCTFNTVEHPFRLAKKLISQMSSEPSESKLICFLESINEFVEIKPNFQGIGVDLNAVIEKAIDALKEK
jgi:hypothetical protein